MKLCSDLLYWKLKDALGEVDLRGTASSKLALNRPEFYLENTKKFKAGHVYVCSSDHLPVKPQLEEDVCLVCLGRHVNLTAFYNHSSVIVVEAEINIFSLFNLVQGIFDIYEDWEEGLWETLRHGANLSSMIDSSREIFSNPMLLIGSDFRYLAVSDEDYIRNDLGIRLDTKTFDADVMARFLSIQDLKTHIHEPLLMELQGARTLSVNLFDHDEYLGCLTIFEAFRPLHESDSSVAVLFGQILRRAIQQNPVLASSRSAVRHAIHDVIVGNAVDFEHRRALAEENKNKEWICLRFEPKEGIAQLPNAYLTAAIESRHPGSFAFECEGSVAGIFSTNEIDDSSVETLVPLLEQFGLACGVSGTFQDLYEANRAWFQATNAIQNGRNRDVEQIIYHFEDYLLPLLLSSAMSKHAAVSYFPEGLKRLKSHDETSQVSYMQTLKVFLDTEQSVTKTASLLHLHRSTLLDRLDHIKRLLDSDLKDPNFCLVLRILLHAESLQK